MKTRRGVAQASRFVIGLDFGTLSARALLVEARTGRELATAVHDYGEGVIETELPGDRRRLPARTALQNPADYLEAMRVTVPQIVREAGVNPEDVVGIGVDFTCCTVLPVTAAGAPLCFERRWRKNPHAWVKLWKHHSAQPQADYINEVARRRQEYFLNVYGGKYSSEWFFSKLLETVEAAPEVYAAAGRFIEAGDWVVWQLCGEEKRSLSAAGFKAMWVYPKGKEDGSALGWKFPEPDFFRALHPQLAEVISDKVASRFYPLGAKAGGLTKGWADALGLKEGTAVAVANIDAHAAVPACGVTTPGKMVLILGTSTCHLLLSTQRKEVEGICGVVRDGVVPGYWGYEAGQPGVGDMFAWFVENAVPGFVADAAAKSNLDVHAWLEAEAAKLHPGETGLLAIDWWNGNRSVLVDADLSGALIGLTLSTRPAEIYRALIEATAFGTRKIIETFAREKIHVNKLYACGGLAKKNKLLLQIYADVTGLPIRVAASEQASALGAAMQGAVAAGVFRTIHEAAKKIGRTEARIYKPNRAARSTYDALYAEYSRLHDLFGRNPSSTLKVLKEQRDKASRFRF